MLPQYRYYHDLYFRDVCWNFSVLSEEFEDSIFWRLNFIFDEIDYWYDMSAEREQLLLCMFSTINYQFMLFIQVIPCWGHPKDISITARRGKLSLKRRWYSTLSFECPGLEWNRGIGGPSNLSILSYQPQELKMIFDLDLELWTIVTAITIHETIITSFLKWNLLLQCHDMRKDSSVCLISTDTE